MYEVAATTSSYHFLAWSVASQASVLRVAQESLRAYLFGARDSHEGSPIMTRHVAVWIDQQEAKIYHIDAASTDATKVASPGPHVHRHPTVTAEHNHPADAPHFYADVVRALQDAQEILIVGPAKAKLELIKYVHKHHPAMEPRIVGVETVDHPSDGQLVAYARRYFHAADRMR
jgi:stalled ribosome rescue protein Dom34